MLRAPNDVIEAFRAPDAPRRNKHTIELMCGERFPGMKTGNEKFSGRGHRNQICKDSQRLPRDQRDRIERMDELYGFLEQPNISRKNITRLEILAHANSEVKDLAPFHFGSCTRQTAQTAALEISGTKSP